jgi:hypothetical protein
MIQPGQIGRWVSRSGEETMWFICERHQDYNINGETKYTPKGRMVLGPDRYADWREEWNLDDDIVKIVPDDEVPGEVWASIAAMRLTGKPRVNEGA